MGLESGTYVSDLVKTNPPTSDQETQGANHLQLIKTVLQNTLPDGSKPVYFPKVLSKSANYSVLNGDDNTIILADATGGSFTLTLPTPTNAGWHVRVVKIDSSANTVTIQPPLGTISGQASIVLDGQWMWDRFEWGGSTYTNVESTWTSGILLGRYGGTSGQEKAVTVGSGLSLSGAGALSVSSTLVPPPQGYLTPTSGVPVILSAVAATSIFYTPYVGNLCPIYNGTSFVLFTFAELTLTLAAGSQVADGLYDVFGFNNSGSMQIAFGPSWGAGTGGNQTPGTCARGTGAGGTALQRINGIWTNAATMSAANNGATTYNIPANQGTYLGTIYVDHTAGQVTCSRGIGQNRKFGIFNAYNRVPCVLQVTDATASWTYNTNTLRASNNVPSSWTGTEFNQASGTTCNGVTVLDGLGEECVEVDFRQGMTFAGATANGSKLAIGVNSTTVGSGIVAQHGATEVNARVTLNAMYFGTPVLGLTTYCCLEQSVSAVTDTRLGTTANMLMRVGFRT